MVVTFKIKGTNSIYFIQGFFFQIKSIFHLDSKSQYIYKLCWNNFNSISLCPVGSYPMYFHIIHPQWSLGSKPAYGSRSLSTDDILCDVCLGHGSQYAAPYTVQSVIEDSTSEPVLWKPDRQVSEGHLCGVCVCVCVCLHACVCVCMRACVRAWSRLTTLWWFAFSLHTKTFLTGWKLLANTTQFLQHSCHCWV